MPATINQQMELAEQGWSPLLGEDGKPEAWVLFLPLMQRPVLWLVSSDRLPFDYSE